MGSVPHRPGSAGHLGFRAPSYWVSPSPMPSGVGTSLKGIGMSRAEQQGGGSWEGMNPDVVESQARILNGLSGEIATLIHKIEGEVTALADAWHGDDSRRFAAEWAGTHKPVFTMAATLLADMGDISQRSAAAQRSTSAH